MYILLILGHNTQIRRWQPKWRSQLNASCDAPQLQLHVCQFHEALSILVLLVLETKATSTSTFQSSHINQYMAFCWWCMNAVLLNEPPVLHHTGPIGLIPSQRIGMMHIIICSVYRLLASAALVMTNDWAQALEITNNQQRVKCSRPFRL